MTKYRPPRSWFQRCRHGLIVVIGAAGLSLLVFSVLPLMQSISRARDADTLLLPVDVGQVEPPPPPPVQEEKPEEPEPEEAPPELTEDAPPLALDQLELALNPGLSSGIMGAGDFAVKLNTLVSAREAGDVDAIFSMADLDQAPRATWTAQPTVTPKMRRQTPATVYIIFIVDQNGRVVDPRVQKSTNPLFDNAALTALKKWKFEPGKRAGKPVRFRMRIPMTFPKKG